MSSGQHRPRPSGQAPEGYLGTDARIASGPAPELIEAGYSLEMRDARLLHEGLHLADLAHVLVLSGQGLLPDEVTRPLMRGLLALREVPFEEFPYDVELGDAYNSRERELSRRLGDLAGWVHLGRTRREAGRIAFRLAIRDLFLDLADAVVELTATLAERADELADAVWADMTYLQPAQPSTFGHYLASFAEESARHLERLKNAYAWADVSPAGSGGVAGTRLSLDRTSLAAALGFGAVGRNTRDTMWNLDGLIDAVSASTQAVLTADRLAEDLLIFASAPFGLVQLDASLCRASVLMPQKRNPYALAVIRAGASAMVGRLTGTVTTARTPSAQTDNWLHTYGDVAESLRLARRLVALATAVVRTLRVDREALLATAQDPQCASTDLADELVRLAEVDYRTAYRIVGRAVATTLETGQPLTAEVIDSAALALTGRSFPVLDEARLLSVFNPQALVVSRHELGGCAPASVRTETKSLRRTAEAAAAWVKERRAAHAYARDQLLERARATAS